MLAKRRRPLSRSKKRLVYNATWQASAKSLKLYSAALPSMRSERGSRDSRRAHLFRKQAAPACCASTGARAPEPTGLGSGKPWPPALMLEVFYLFQVPAAPALAVLPMKGPPFGTAHSIVAYWDGLPTPSSSRHAESHALRAHVVVVFAPGRALEWKLISASSRSAPRETAVSGEADFSRSARLVVGTMEQQRIYIETK